MIMKCSTIFLASSLGLYTYPIHAQLIFTNPFRHSEAVAQYNQKPMMNEPSIVLPPGSKPAGGNTRDPNSSDELRISDVIGKERSINIFAGFTRDIETISRRLDDASQNTTILAPLNSQIEKLPQKPWEDPRDYGAMGAKAYEGSGGEDRAYRNLRRFTEAHTIPTSPWVEGEKIDTLNGNKIWWEHNDGKKMIRPDNIEVSSIASQVSNGEVWIIKGVLNIA